MTATQIAETENQSEENYHPTIEATLDLGSKQELTFRDRKTMTKLSPKINHADPSLSSKVESFMSSAQLTNAKSAARVSVISSAMHEGKSVPFMVNASKNLFDILDQDRQAREMLVSKDSKHGPMMQEHSRKAGLTLVRD